MSVDLHRTPPVEPPAALPPGPGGPPRPTRPMLAGIPLGRWAGVPVSAHWSVFATLFIFTDMLARSALPADEPHRSPMAYWLVGTLTATAFFVTLLCHEVAHAVAARHYGMRAERITLWMLGGLTELDGDPPSARADGLIAAAGPLTSAAFGAICGAGAWGVNGAGFPGAALAWLGGVNVVLAAFNLLPAAPLDGGRLLRAILWRIWGDRARAAAGAGRAGRGLGVALVVFGLLELMAGYFAGLWLVVVGWFISAGATQERSAAGLQRIRELPVERVMAPLPPLLPDWWTVDHLLDTLTPAQAAAPFFVLTDFSGAVTAAISLRDVERVRVTERHSTRLRELRPRRQVAPLTVTTATAVDEVIAELPRHGGIAVVTDPQQGPVGVVTIADLARAARLTQAGWQHRGGKPADD